MAHKISRILFVALIAASTAGADEAKCSAAARECDHQIRQMLSGRRYLGATIEERDSGLVIKSVHPEGPAARAGLQAEDRLIAVNGKSLADATSREFKQAIAAARSTGRLFIIIWRGGVYSRIEARLEPYSREQIDKIIDAHLAHSHQATADAN